MTLDDWFAALRASEDPAADILVCADWLEEKGDPRAAELRRLKERRQVFFDAASRSEPYRLAWAELRDNVARGGPNVIPVDHPLMQRANEIGRNAARADLIIRAIAILARGYGGPLCVGPRGGRYRLNHRTGARKYLRPAPGR